MIADGVDVGFIMGSGLGEIDGGMGSTIGRAGPENAGAVYCVLTVTGGVFVGTVDGHCRVENSASATANSEWPPSCVIRSRDWTMRYPAPSGAIMSLCPLCRYSRSPTPPGAKSRPCPVSSDTTYLSRQWVYSGTSARTIPSGRARH